jgi:hypothetical protein
MCVCWPDSYRCDLCALEFNFYFFFFDLKFMKLQAQHSLISFILKIIIKLMQLWFSFYSLSPLPHFIQSIMLIKSLSLQIHYEHVFLIILPRETMIMHMQLHSTRITRLNAECWKFRGDFTMDFFLLAEKSRVIKSKSCLWD